MTAVAEESIADELFEPCCIIAATFVVSALCLAMWYFSLKAPRKASSSEDASEECDALVAPRGDGGALAWLAALVVTSLLLLVFQLALGFGAGALTLIADSAHTAADAVSYAFTWFVERAKLSTRTAQSAKAKRVAVRFDAFSAIFSVAIVLVTSVGATSDALRRLLAPSGDPTEGADGTAAEEANRFIGPALLGFAVFSTAANVVLLAMHRRRAASKLSAAAAQSPEPRIEGDAARLASPPPPPPPAAEAQREGRRERAARRGAGLKLLHQAFHPSCDLADCPINHGDAPPSPPPRSEEDGLQCPPPPPPVLPADSVQNAGTVSNGRRRPARRGERLKLLHQAFHPSCELDDCPCAPAPGPSGTPSEASESDGDSISGSSAASGASIAPTRSTAAGDEDNLNLYGAVLHLLTDVLRSVVILVVGILVQLGVIRDSASADAVCALVVSACILLGSLALLRTAAAALCGRRAHPRAELSFSSQAV